MKVLLLNGSTRKNGCVYTCFKEIEKILMDEGIEVEIYQLGSQTFKDCLGCNYCVKSQTNKCVTKDDCVNELIDKIKEIDGIIVGSPVYFSHPTGQLLAVLNRIFYAAGQYLEHKPAAAIVTERRSGGSSSIDVLNKYFLNNNMPIISSTYWNIVHGTSPDQIKQDLEGLQTMRNLARNMAHYLKNNKDKDKPKLEKEYTTNFIR